MRWLGVFCVLLTLTLSGCVSPAPKSDIQEPRLQKASFAALPGWKQDHLQGALQAFLTSCSTLLKQPADRPFKPAGRVGDFHMPCRKAESVNASDLFAVRSFFEAHFDPYEVREAGSHKTEGLFTGYYEASLKGALRRYGPYQTPLYGLPRDLYSADLGAWYEELAGKKITAQIKNGQLRRYPDHATIKREGVSAEVIAWVDDPVDKFFLQIQGSGVVKLDSGGTLRVGYAGKNGHEYYAIGRALIARGELTKENVSLQTIRAWMAAHPEQADDLMNLNPSYVFFKQLKTSGPVGAQGVVLTAGRSLAVDKNLYSYGMPVWLQAEHPHDSVPLSRLMIAQDTGGAIRGVVRGDVFWGYGADAEDMAGKMKSRGQYWLLLPRYLSK